MRTSVLLVPVLVTSMLAFGASALRATDVVPTQRIVVGNGTAASCTEAALLNALEAARVLGGAIIRFRCGADPVTIPLTRTEAGLTFPNNTIINGGGLVTLEAGFQAFRFDVDTSVRLTELAVTHPRLENFGALTIDSSVLHRGQNGAILNHGTLLIRDTMFETLGGSNWPLTNHGTATINRTQFLNTVGAIYNDGHLAVRNSRFVESQFEVINNAGGFITIDNSEFSDNHGINVGAISSRGGSLTIRDSSFNRNVASGGGAGAISTGDGALVTIKNSEFFDNVGFSGAISSFFGGEGQVTIATTTFSGNFAAFRGGAIAISSPHLLRITDSTITGNTADDGGGIFVGGAVAPKIVRTTVTGNTPNDIVIHP